MLQLLCIYKLLLLQPETVIMIACFAILRFITYVFVFMLVGFATLSEIFQL